MAPKTFKTPKAPGSAGGSIDDWIAIRTKPPAEPGAEGPTRRVFVALVAVLMSMSGSIRPSLALELVAVEAAVPAPAVAAQQQQMRAQFEPVLKVELSFVNRVCKLSDAERRTLIAKSSNWLDTYVRNFAKHGGQQQPGNVWMAGRGGGQHPLRDPRAAVQVAVGELVKANLPKERAALYEEESRKRNEFQQQAAVENLVGRIDTELKLSPEQRERITLALTEHWDRSWAPQLEMFVHGMDIWPNVPDQWITPHLSAAQRMAWGRLNKSSGQVFFGGHVFGDGQVIDDIDLTDVQEQAVAAEANPPVVER